MAKWLPHEIASGVAPVHGDVAFGILRMRKDHKGSNPVQRAVVALGIGNVAADVPH